MNGLCTDLGPISNFLHGQQVHLLEFACLEFLRDHKEISPPVSYFVVTSYALRSRGEISHFANLLTVDYNATLHMLSKEINPKIVQEQLGHSSIHLTLNTYSHVIKSMRGIAANALEEVVGSD